MKIILILALLCTTVFAQETISKFDDNVLSVLNDELRDLRDRLYVIDDVTLEKNSTNGYIQLKLAPVADGGTGQDFSSTAKGNIIYFSNTGIMSVLSPGTSGYFLQSQGNGNAPVYALDNNTSNVVFSWSGIDTAASDTHGIYVGTDNNPIIGGVSEDADANNVYLVVFGTTYRTVLNFKFKKIASISTLTVHARLWSDNADSDKEAYMKVDINSGTYTEIKSTTSSSPGWVTTSTINVSGLTNGTTYNGVVQLKSENVAQSAYCSSIFLIAS